MARRLVTLAILVGAAGAVAAAAIAEPFELGRLVPGQSASASENEPSRIVTLPREFLVNLADDRYARAHVALILEPADDDAEEETATRPRRGYAGIPEEAVVRDTITSTLTGVDARRLLSDSGRRALKRRIIARIRERTDLPLESVLVTDLVVQ